MVLHWLMSFCLFLKLMPVYERLVNKSTLVFPAMHRYHQSTVFTEYSIYWRAVDHPRVLTEVSWLKPSSALMKKSRWKPVVNRWHKMTFNQLILLTNRQLICGRSKFLRGRRKLLDISFMSCCIIGSKWCYVRFSSVFSGTGACEVSTVLLTMRRQLRKYTSAFHRILPWLHWGNDDKRPREK